MEDDVVERKCAVCGAVIEGSNVEVTEECRCYRCGSTGRYERKELIALHIPDYQKRLDELSRLNRDLTADIYLEGLRGVGRDMRYIQDKHLQRQRILAEYSFLSYFRPFIEKW